MLCVLCVGCKSYIFFIIARNDKEQDITRRSVKHNMSGSDGQKKNPDGSSLDNEFSRQERRVHHPDKTETHGKYQCYITCTDISCIKALKITKDTNIDI